MLRSKQGPVERTFSYTVPNCTTNPVKSRLSPGKKLVLLLTQVNPDGTMFTNIFPKFEHFFRAYGFNDVHLIRACGVSAPGEVEARRELLTTAEEMAKRL